MDHLPSLDYLKTYFGDLSEEEYEVLLKEYGGKEDDLIQLIYEALDETPSLSISGLVRKLKQTSINESNLTAALPVEHQPVPVTVLRNPPGMDARRVRLYLSKYLKNPSMKEFLQSLSENQQQSLAASLSSPGVLILMRGASGSGKSTLANLIWSINTKARICSADKYVVNAQGEFVFDKRSLGKAHQACRDDCRRSLARGTSPVIIDHQNIRIDNMIPYVKLAIEFNYNVKILEPDTEWKKDSEQLARASGVSKKMIEGQLRGFEIITERDLLDKVLKNHKDKLNYLKVRGWSINDSATASQEENAKTKSLAKLERIFHFKEKQHLEKKFRDNNCDLSKTIAELINDAKALLLKDNQPVNEKGGQGSKKSCFEMVLPIKFAKYLIKTFGVAEDAKLKLTSDMLKVEIDPNTAFNFFSKLYVNLVEAAKTEATENQQVRNENVPNHVAAAQQQQQQDDAEYQLHLPTAFAKILLQTYHDERELTSSEVLKIQISSETAFDLFTQLYSNVCTIMTESRNINQEEDFFFSEDVIEAVSGEAENFQELLEELKAIRGSIESNLTQKYAAPHRNQQQKKDFLLIKKEYSHVDPLVVDEVFTHCFLDVEKTKEKLNELYPAVAAAAENVEEVAGPSSSNDQLLDKN